MTDEEIKHSWAEMSKDFSLRVHISIDESANNSKGVKSMTLVSDQLAFKILQGNSLLVIAGSYGTYAFRDVYDIFKLKAGEFFMADDYEAFFGSLISIFIANLSGNAELMRNYDPFKYSCEAIKLAVEMYQEMLKELRTRENEPMSLEKLVHATSRPPAPYARPESEQGALSD